jgi:hypothetical protein
MEICREDLFIVSVQNADESTTVGKWNCETNVTGFSDEKHFHLDGFISKQNV